MGMSHSSLSPVARQQSWPGVPAGVAGDSARTCSEKETLKMSGAGRPRAAALDTDAALKMV